MARRALKSESKDTGFARVRSSDQRSENFFASGNNNNAALLRKASCACGGGCSACQAKSSNLKVSQPNDAAEIEADQIADQVMRKLAHPVSQPLDQNIGGVHEIQRKASGITPPAGERNSESKENEIAVGENQIKSFANGAGDGSKVSDVIQRMADPEEDAADAAADAAMAEPELEGGDEDEDDDSEGESEEDSGESDEIVQTKRSSGGASAAVSDSNGQLFRGISESRSSGAPMAQPVRDRMESAFDADFSSVRVHTGGRAAELAGSVQALAFTTGSDIFFAEGQYDPHAAHGQHLLAHELAHVLQQGAAPAFKKNGLSSYADNTIQRAPGEENSKGKLIGEFYYFDAQGGEISQLKLKEMEPLGIAPGYYEVKITSLGGGKYQFKIVGGETYQLVQVSNSAKQAELLKKAARIFLHVYRDTSGAKSDEAEKPSADDTTGPAGVPKESPPPVTEPGTEGKSENEPPPPKPDPGTQQGEKDAPKPGTDTGTADGGTKKPGDTAGTPQEGDKGKDGGLPLPGGSTGGSSPGIPGEQKKGGSKYGVFGLLELPQAVIDLLEGALEILGDSEEMLAISETLRTLKELAEHHEALGELFKDSDSLLEVALGFKDDPAMTAIENWVARDIKSVKSSKSAGLKGVAALAIKVVTTVGKMRKVLKPVFKVRGTVQSAIGGVGMIMEGVSSLEHVLEMASDPGKFADLELQSALDEFAADFAGELKVKIDSAPKQFKDGFVKFSESDLVTYEELAQAVTAALLAVVPKAYKPVVKAVKGTGLDKTIADNVIAPLIPEEALKGLNSLLSSLIKILQPTIDAVTGDMQKIIDELAPGFIEELPGEMKSFIKPSRKPGRAGRRFSPRSVARLIGQSAGDPLDEDTHTEAETRMGQPLGGVRVHTDSAAAEASERLNANAFTIGSDVYFGPGKFAPDTNEGRRLLYHELAHTAQQQDNGGLALQPDYKDLLSRLAKRFSASVIAELKGASTTSPSKQTQILVIKDKVAKLIGRTVNSRTNPALPTGYMYIPKNKGKIKTIRRTLAWIRFIPALTIDKTRKIRLAALLSRFDPKAPARRALRAALGCTGTHEAHHIVPLELFLHPVAKTAVKNGFKFNGAQNGVCISDKIHAGSHPIYTAAVRSRLDDLESKFGSDWSKLQVPLQLEIDKLRTDLKARRSKLR